MLVVASSYGNSLLNCVMSPYPVENCPPSLKQGTLTRCYPVCVTQLVIHHHLDASSLYITSKHAGPKRNWILELYLILDLSNTKRTKTMLFRDLDALPLLRCSLGLPQLCPQTHYTTDSHRSLKATIASISCSRNWCQAESPTWCFFKETN